MGVLVLLTITQIIRIGSSRDNLLVLMRQNEGIKQRIPCFIEGCIQRIPCFVNGKGQRIPNNLQLEIIKE